MNKFENVFELVPRNGRKSFYGKALVELNPKDNSQTLYSYLTPIMRKNSDGILVRLYDDNPSHTTCAHIKSFCGLCKKEFEKLPFEA